ncbi:ABC transporter ATP-binding protein [Pseudomaricurvus alkylphenolicus]|jgi:ABC-2 type transport system ATP-binding protein|uniref:ABC transporter ATP-binding protein n=1 Tax=Pseudomaricurvus alkylphenolicus TaxID=1306991 RepID=UPI00141F0705|nr:ABC transporter ATP-binding protein [Pseudomaricurvus alkylphenolicus]NIB42041.1 ABC transporter ATP-binding protein [Pseudomaricurvus alkylphenolicus]
MIEIKQLTKRFGHFTAVDNLSFTVRPGEVLGFLGPNGAGKSTTMRMLSGFLKPDTGSVTVFGQDVVRSPLEAKRLMGYLPEGAPSYGDMRVRSFLNFIAEARGVAPASRDACVDRVVERLQLQDVQQRPVETLSKGFQRRVGIAQALLHDPQVLVLDEPTDGLDPNQKFEVRQLIRELSSDKIVIISTHILEEVEAVCQRAIIINQGRLVADATPAELKASSDYYQAIELEVEQPMAVMDALKTLPGVRQIYISSDSDHQLIVVPEEGQHLWQPVQLALQEQGIEPKAMSISSGRLDDVFRRVTAAANEGVQG